MKTTTRLPFVSVLTPTYNRRPFIAQLLRNFRKQFYPINRMELIIVDDGTDNVEDLLCSLNFVNYIRLSQREQLGHKRNIAADAARGEIMVHMDDDDYYPPSRVSHAVEQLELNSAMLAGASMLFSYNLYTKTIITEGPYGLNHGTNATFAYRKKYFSEHRFDDAATTKDEALFTDGFCQPMLQLDAKKTMLCIFHNINTVMKNSLSNTAQKFNLKEFVCDKNSLRFYRYQLPKLLEKYKPGI